MALPAVTGPPKDPKKPRAPVSGASSYPSESLHTQKKSARRSERPSQSCTRWTLHLRITLLGRVIPHAAFFVATSLVRRLRHVSSKGWGSHGQGQRHCNHRDNSFHECSPYQTLSATGLPGNDSDLEI